MSRVFEGVMDELARKSGYSYDELVDIYNEAWQECEDAGEDLNLMICGVFWIVHALIINTRNTASAIFFKVIPFFTGLATIMCAMDLFGWVNIFH